jgi:hypothetical protein
MRSGKTSKRGSSTTATSDSASATRDKGQSVGFAEDSFDYRDEIDLPETFVDSLDTWTFEHGMVRLTFTVDRVSRSPHSGRPRKHRVPVARLVTTPKALAAAAHELQKLVAALEHHGHLPREPARPSGASAAAALPRKVRVDA